MAVVLMQRIGVALSQRTVIALFGDYFEVVNNRAVRLLEYLLLTGQLVKNQYGFVVAP